jgi:membrane fusion protein, adhesin transport system
MSEAALELDRLRQGMHGSGWRTLAFGAIALVAAFVIWASWAEFDQFAVAEGEVAPLDKVKVIQHLEGGIIANIFVADGQMVMEGDPLIELNLAITGTNKAELAARLDGLFLARARLTAEADGTEPVFPAEIVARRPDSAAAEMASFMARRTELDNRLNAAEERVHQEEMAVREMVVTSQATATDLNLSRKNLAMSDDLLRDGLTSKMEHLQREREAKLLEGKLSALQASIPKAKAGLAEARNNVDNETQAARKILKAPVDGIVKNLRYHTIGGVVAGGDPVMEIVPVNENLVIEARLGPQDSGRVEIGQPVRLKISAYDYSRFGTLPGTLTYVGADTVNDPDGVPYFQVIVKPDRAYLGGAPGELPIRPGMVATADIRTGSKTVMEYLMKPIVRLQYDALHEP